MKEFLFDFLNGPLVPAAMMVAGILIFTIVYYQTEKQVNAYRKEFQQKIVNGQAFREHFNAFREPVYAVGKKEKEFKTSDGTAISLPDDKPLELIFHKLAEDSQVPSNGYAVICEKADVRKSDAALLLYFSPACHKRAEWTVLFADKKHIVCKHPHMGRVMIDAPANRKFGAGDVVTLKSDVRMRKEDIFSHTPEECPHILRYEIL